MHSGTKMIIRPQKGSYPEYFSPYIALVPEDVDIIEFLSEQKAAFIDFINQEIRAVKNAPYAEGKWSVKQLLGHLIDTERIFCHRALFIARNDSQDLPGFEQEDYVNAGEFESRSLDSLIGEFEVMRENTLILLKSIPASAYDRRGMINGLSTVFTAIPFLIAGHLAHHRNILKLRYIR